MTEAPGQKTEVIAFASGKGGTGKTSLLATLGYAFQAAGLRVLYIDADLATDGLSLFLLGPQGAESLSKNAVPENTLDGYLRASVADQAERWRPIRVSRPDHGDASWSYTLLMSSLHLYGDEVGDFDVAQAGLPRGAYQAAVRTLFDDIRRRREWDYVLVDTRGGFAHDTVEICVLADSFVLVTEPNTTNFYQDRNLFTHILGTAKRADTRPVLRGVFVNKALNYPEAEYGSLVQRAYDLEAGDIFTIPIDPEAIGVYQQQKAIYEAAPGSTFAGATLRAYASMFGVVTAAWTAEQITAWQVLAKRLETAAKEKLARWQRDERRRRGTWVALAVVVALAFVGVWFYGESRVNTVNRTLSQAIEQNRVLDQRLAEASLLARQSEEAKASLAEALALAQRSANNAQNAGSPPPDPPPDAGPAKLPPGTKVLYYPHAGEQGAVNKALRDLGATAVEGRLNDWLVDPDKEGTPTNTLVYLRPTAGSKTASPDTVRRDVYAVALGLLRAGVVLRAIEAWNETNIAPPEKPDGSPNFLNDPGLLQLTGCPEASRLPPLTEQSLRAALDESTRRGLALESSPAATVAAPDGGPRGVTLFYHGVSDAQRQALAKLKEFLERRGYQVALEEGKAMPAQTEVRYLLSEDTAQALALARQLSLLGAASVRRSQQPAGRIAPGKFEVWFQTEGLPSVVGSSAKQPSKIPSKRP